MKSVSRLELLRYSKMLEKSEQEEEVRQKWAQVFHFTFKEDGLSPKAKIRPKRSKKRIQGRKTAMALLKGKSMGGQPRIT